MKMILHTVAILLMLKHSLLKNLALIVQLLRNSIVFLWNKSLSSRTTCYNHCFWVPLFLSPQHTVLLWHAICNKSSYSAIEDLLQLLLLLYPDPNFLPSSLYKLNIIFKKFSSNYEKMHTCMECKNTLNREESCDKKRSYLIQVPVEKALKSIVQSSFNHFSKMVTWKLCT